MLFWAEVVVRPTAALLATLSLGEAEVLGQLLVDPKEVEWEYGIA